MKEYEKNHRGHREGNKFNLCSPKEYPLQDVTKKIISEAQLLTYLKAMGKRVGLLINFNVLRLKEGIKRLIL